MTAAKAGFLGNGGYDMLDDIETRINERKEEAGKPWRYFMKVGEERRLVFLTDDPPIIEEHNMRVNGMWGNTFTCLKHPALGGSCPLCDSGDRSATVGFYLVLDRTGYVNKKGARIKDVVRVLPAKFNSLKQFKKFSLKYGGLVGVEFEVSRSNDKAASIGDIYLKEDKHSMTVLEAMLGNKELSEVMVDWEAFLAPASFDELEALVGAAPAAAGSRGSKSSMEGSAVDFE